MNLSASDTDRALIPRWRSFSNTLAAQELTSSTISLSRQMDAGPYFISTLERWLLSPSLVNSAELVESAIVSGRYSEARDAARRLIEDGSAATPLIQEQAARLLVLAGHPDDVPPNFSKPSSVSLRTLTKLYPKDPIAWVDLALMQTISGANSAAIRSMAIALSLAPENRHVLRSASRLYFHCGDRDRAHSLLAKSAATAKDPWLISGEIALAELAGANSRFYKRGRELLASQTFSPRHLSELAGTLATDELNAGNNKKSRRMFAMSLADPTAHALAQAEWAAPRLGRDVAGEARAGSHLVEEAPEADAFRSYREFRFRETVEACLRWAAEDEFSTRPSEFGSIAASHAEDFDAAVTLARWGLRRLALEHDSWSDASVIEHRFSNTLAFALASAGRPLEAIEALRKASSKDELQQLISDANRGLIAMRTGYVEHGVAIYNEVINSFKRARRDDLAAQASIYFAREAMLSGVENRKEIVLMAKEHNRRFKDSESILLLRRLENEAGVPQSPLPSTMEIVNENSNSKRAKFENIKWETPGLPDYLKIR